MKILKSWNFQQADEEAKPLQQKDIVMVPFDSVEGRFGTWNL